MISITRALKTSEISLVLCTHEKSDVFSTLDEMYLVFTSKNSISYLLPNGIYTE